MNNSYWMDNLLVKAKRTIRLNSFGKAFPITEMTPTAPIANKGYVIASSPDITLKLSGLFLINIIGFEQYYQKPLYGNNVAIFFANFNVVSAFIFTPVMTRNIIHNNRYR